MLATVVILFYFLTGYLILIGFHLLSGNLFNPLHPPGSLLPTAEQTVYMLLAALAIGLGHWFFSTRNLVQRIVELIGAQYLDPGDAYHQYFRNIVDEIVIATGSRPLEAMVIPMAGMEAFALADFQGRAVIGVTEGVLARLSRSQIEAVVAHEAAHILSGDCLDVTVTCSLGELYDELFEKIRLGMRHFNRAFILGVFLFVIVGLARGLSMLLRAFISREREYRADALAVRMTRDPQSLAEALKIIGRSWRGMGLPGEMLQSIFIVNPRGDRLDESEGVWADLLSSHPPVRKRVGILLDMLHMSEPELEDRLQDARRASPVVKTTQLSAAMTAVPETAAAGSSGCPCCGKPLQNILYEGAPIQGCPACAGTLVDKRVISRILARQDLEYSPQTLRLCRQILLDAKKHLSLKYPGKYQSWVLACPRCGQKMHREFFQYSYPVEVDRCIYCQTVWFDHQELEILQYLYEHNRELFDSEKSDDDQS